MILRFLCDWMLWMGFVIPILNPDDPINQGLQIIFSYWQKNLKQNPKQFLF